MSKFTDPKRAEFEILHKFGLTKSDIVELTDPFETDTVKALRELSSKAVNYKENGDLIMYNIVVKQMESIKNN